MAAKKTPPPKLNSYRIIMYAIERGIAPGVRRYLKYRENENEPEDMDAFVETVVNYIENELDQVVKWDD